MGVPHIGSKTSNLQQCEKHIIKLNEIILYKLYTRTISISFFSVYGKMKLRRKAVHH